MKRSAIARLHDVLAMIDAANGIVEGRASADDRADLTMRRAIARCVEVRSEASRNRPPDEKTCSAAVPWSEIAAICNKLRHEYDRIDDLILWRIATISLPDLRPVIVMMLDDAPPI